MEMIGTNLWLLGKMGQSGSSSDRVNLDFITLTRTGLRTSTATSTFYLLVPLKTTNLNLRYVMYQKPTRLEN